MLHILTKEQMLRKFIDEDWEQKLAMFNCTIIPCGEHKTIKKWRYGTTTMGCTRERRYSPAQVTTLVCLLRDGNDLYSFDESYFTL